MWGHYLSIIMIENVWRLIINKPAPGSWNMAVDESILEHVAQKNTPPTLRLYAWDPYCLSLGYAQSYCDVDMDLLKQKGWSLVRRPTGGKAILHADELTYSISALQDNPCVYGTVLESYRRLSKALLHALKILGINADSKVKDHSLKSQNTNAICFEIPSDYEITYQGKKIIGSAQARRLQGVLQHGAIPLYGEIDRITQVLFFNSEAEREKAALDLLARAATLQEILSRKITWSEIVSSVVKGFETELGLTLNPGELTNQENQRAKELSEKKYLRDDWNKRV